MDLLEFILERFELVFFMIIAIGSAVASAMKQRKQKERKEAGRAERLENAREEARVESADAQAQVDSGEPVQEWLETFFGEEQATAQAAPPEPTPPPVPVAPVRVRQPRTLHEPIGAPSTFSSLAPTLPGSGVGSRAPLSAGSFDGLSSFTPSSSDTESSGLSQRRKAAWKPTANWREAILLQEILAPPRVFRPYEPPY